MERGLLPVVASAPPPPYSFLPQGAEAAAYAQIHVVDASPLAGGFGGSVGRVTLEPNFFVGHTSPYGEYDSRLPLELQGLVNAQDFALFIGEINNFVSRYHWLRHWTTLMILCGFAMFGLGGFEMTETDGRQPALVIAGFVVFVLGGIGTGYVRKLALADYQRFVARQCEDATLRRFPPCVFRFNVTFTGVAFEHHVHGDGHGHRRSTRRVYQSNISIEFQQA